MIDFRLGRLPQDPVKSARNIAFATYLSPAYVPPASSDRYHIGQAWGMLGNDRYGDCVFAAVGHKIQVDGYYGNKVNPPITAAQVLAAYSAVTGFDPNVPGSDQGATLQDGLGYWRNTGIDGYKIDAYAEITPSVTDHIRAAVDLFGGVYVGVALPNNILPAGNIPDWIPTTGAPNPWNGHCVEILGYDQTYLYLCTWGTIIRMSYPFLVKYCDEAHGTLSPDFSKLKPGGYDYTALLAAVAQLTGGGPIVIGPPPTPIPVPAPPPFPVPTPVPPVPPVPTPPILMRVLRLSSPHMTGADVRYLQQRLIAKGYNLGKWGADGDFGTATRAAWVAFQKSTFPKDSAAWTGVVDPTYHLLIT